MRTTVYTIPHLEQGKWSIRDISEDTFDALEGGRIWPKEFAAYLEGPGEVFMPASALCPDCGFVVYARRIPSRWSGVFRSEFGIDVTDSTLEGEEIPHAILVLAGRASAMELMTELLRRVRLRECCRQRGAWVRDAAARCRSQTPGA